MILNFEPFVTQYQREAFRVTLAVTKVDSLLRVTSANVCETLAQQSKAGTLSDVAIMGAEFEGLIAS